MADNQLNQWLGIELLISLVGRHESNGTEHVNALFMGHLRRLVHDERLTHRWASDTVLPLINHALATSPNDELGSLSPIELKFGTQAIEHLKLLPPLVPGNNYTALAQQLDANLAVVRSATSAFQATLRMKRHTTTPSQNQLSPGDVILWNPRENAFSFRSTKLAPKLLGPYRVISQHKNDKSCEHVVLHNHHNLHSSRVAPFYGTLESENTVALLDNGEFIVEDILSHRGDYKHIKDIFSTLGRLRLDPRLLGAMVSPTPCRQNAHLPSHPWPSLQNTSLAPRRQEQISRMKFHFVLDNPSYLEDGC